MNEIMISVENMTICYHVGDNKAIGLKEFFMKKLTGNYRVRELTAVQDLSFSVERGELFGIVGVNGSGKSTLLKAVCGVMAPTKGSVSCKGKISALLELGSGFDGNLTVKENTFLRGALLGYSKEYMKEVYPDILDFAELQEFQDFPFRQLSSGMQARLAFSLSSIVNPDILILDEVLAVGDAAFQKKSEKKMKSIIRSGATTIFVSHSTGQVRDICTKVLWIDKGKKIMVGATQEVCDAYDEFIQKKLEHNEHDESQ